MLFFAPIFLNDHHISVLIQTYQ